MINPGYLRFWGLITTIVRLDDLTAPRWFSQCAGRDGATAILSLSSAGNTAMMRIFVYRCCLTNKGFPYKYPMVFLCSIHWETNLHPGSHACQHHHQMHMNTCFLVPFGHYDWP